MRGPGRGALLNALLAFPGLMIALVIITLMGRGYGAIVLATGLAQVAPVARVVSVAVASVESRDFVEAARGLGGTRWFIVWNHIFPTILPAVAAYASVTFGYCLLNSAALSFLGFSRTPELPDWGVMLKDGRAFVRLAPWISLAPGVLMTVTIAAVNDVTDSLTNMRR